MPNEIAPEGKVWVCLACGKMSQDVWGEQRISQGWDVSCTINCGLFNKRDLEIRDGRVVRINREEKDGSVASDSPVESNI
jgi:hypothetical protein